MAAAQRPGEAGQWLAEAIRRVPELRDEARAEQLVADIADDAAS